MKKGLNKTILYITAFLIPILVLPITQNILDFPKQSFTLFLIFSAFLFWLLEAIYEKKIFLRKESFFYLALFLFFISFLVSSLFSINRQLSFFGSPTDVSDNLLTLLIFLAFVFVLLNSFKEKAEFLTPIFSLVLVTGIIGFLNLFQIYGVYLYPFELAKSSSFNPIGTHNTLAIFMVTILPLSLILAFKSKGIFKKIFSAISVLLFLNILLINFKTAWFLLIIEILILFIFGFREKKTAFFGILTGILTISFFFYLFPLTFSGFPNLPSEVSLSFPAEIYVFKNAISQNIKTLLIGTGPGTFSYNFSLYHSPLLNQTPFWGTRFFKGHSTFFDWIITKGLLGGVSLLFLYIFTLISIFKKLKEEDEFFDIKLTLSSGLIGLIAASFFYPFNFSLYFLFWLFLTSFFFFQNKRTIEYNLSSTNRTLFINTVFVLFFIFSLGLFFSQAKKYLAEIYYFKGIQSSRSLNYDLAINYFQKAINLNPSLDIYWRSLAEISLTKANIVSRDEKIQIEERKRLTNLLITQGADAVNQAVKISPENVANWNLRGFFYQNLVGIEGAATTSLLSYQQAIRLEPNSPYSYTEKGRVYILQAQDFASKKDEISQKEYLNYAVSILQKALELKPDYSVAHYLLGVAYDQLGQSEEAIRKLEEAKRFAIQDWGLIFQLGTLYWRKGDFQKAKTEFEEVLKINPNYSNAQYMLGLVSEKLGERDRAISLFEKLSSENPDNEEIKKILNNVKKGLPIFEGISTTSTKESTLEIQK